MQNTHLYMSHGLREDESESTFMQCQIVSRKQWSDFNKILCCLYVILRRQLVIYNMNNIVYIFKCLSDFHNGNQSK